MKLAVCNEFCEGWDVDRVFALAADTGYQGVELAPFTLAGDVRDIPADRRAAIARQAAGHGIAVVGLHWLLASPQGLHLTHPDAAVREETVAYLKALIHFCGDVGGTKMVFGSPQQRNVMEGVGRDTAWQYARDGFAQVLPDLEARGVDLCLEPLARQETNFITTAGEGLRFCRQMNHPRFRLHLDVKAMCDEGRPLDEIIEACRGVVGHVHANDANRGYPGSGDTDFGPVARGLKAIGYDEWMSVEVFDFKPGPETIAVESYRYLQRFLA